MRRWCGFRSQPPGLARSGRVALTLLLGLVGWAEPPGPTSAFTERFSPGSSFFSPERRRGAASPRTVRAWTVRAAPSMHYFQLLSSPWIPRVAMLSGSGASTCVGQRCGSPALALFDPVGARAFPPAPPPPRAHPPPSPPPRPNRPLTVGERGGGGGGRGWGGPRRCLSFLLSFVFF